MGKKPDLKPHNDGYDAAWTVRVPLWPYLVTPIMCILALPGTWLAHRFFGTGDAAGWTGFFLALGCVALVSFTAWAARPRGSVMRGMATGNILAGCVWTVPAVLNGPFHAVSMAAWTVGTIVLSAAVAVYRIMRQTRGAGQGSVLQGEFEELGDAVKQLRGVAFSRPQITGAKVSTQVTMPAGRTFDEVSDVKKQTASLLDVPVTAVRTQPDPDSERRGILSVVPVDQLKCALPDPGLSAPGGSIAAPIVLGVTEEGERAEVTLPGDPSIHRNAVGVMGVVGMSGSGKTELLLRLIREVGSRHDNELTVIDARKGGQLPGYVKRLARRTAYGIDAAEDLIEGLPARVADRAAKLGALGYKQWQEGCGLPFETFIVFEASAVVARSSTIVDISESVRSVGIGVILELQRATYDRLPTSARSNITTWIVLGVEREDDADAALAEETIAAGAAPWKWKNTKPGYFYLQWGGREQAQWASPNRSYICTDAESHAMLAEALDWPDRLPGPPSPVEAYTPPPEGEYGNGDGDGDGDEGEVPPVAPGVNPDDPPDDVDPSKPIVIPEGMPRIPLGDDEPSMTPEQSLQVLLERIDALEGAGKDSFKPQQMGGVMSVTGMSASWVHKQLGLLCQPGPDQRLRKTARGTYSILTRESV